MEIQIKNKRYYYCDDIININGLKLDKIVVSDVKDGFYSISHKDFYELKPFWIIFDNADGIIIKMDIYHCFAQD